MAYEDEDTIDSLQEAYRELDKVSARLDSFARILEASLAPHNRKDLDLLIGEVADAIDNLGEALDDKMAELTGEEE